MDAKLAVVSSQNPWCGWLKRAANTEENEVHFKLTKKYLKLILADEEKGEEEGEFEELAEVMEVKRKIESI